MQQSSISSVQRMLERTEALRASPGKRWLFAFVAFAIAFAARFWLESRLPPGFPYLTFFPAVILTTFFVGLAPGIAVAAASFFAAWFFFIAPVGSFTFNGPAVIALAFFVVIVAVDILLIHWMHIALDRLKREQMVSHRHAEERDVLFKEMQHRVSNNLAVVSALLNAQKRGLPEGEAATALAQAATRVNLVARMQRDLYDPSHQSLDFAAYLKALGPDILEAMDARHIAYDADVTAIDVSSDMAVPLGLIATELISNSVEHAFAGKRQGRIRVELAEMEGASGAYLMRVRDDGPGWPQAFKPDTSRNLGMRIVLSLAQQIGAQFTYHNDGGAVSSLAFRIDGRKA